MVVAGQRARHLALTHQLGVHRGHPDPVPLKDSRVVVGAVVRQVDRVGVLVGVAAVPPRLLERRLQRCGSLRRPGRGARVALAAREVGEVAQAADRVDGVVELLLAHARALDVAQPFRPAVAVGVELLHDVPHVAHRERVEVVTERVVTGPPPHERYGAGELGGLVGVARRVEGAVVDRPVRHDLVHHLAAAPVHHDAHVAQRPQVGLDVVELAHGHAGEGGVLAVGAEQPGVVRPAGAQPARPRQRALGGWVLAALLDGSELQVVHLLHRVGEVLLAPGDAALQQRVAGEVHLRVGVPRLAGGDLVGEGSGGVGECPGQLGAGRRHALVRAGHREPQGRGTVRLQPDLPAQLAAGALAEGAVVARVGRGAVRRAHHGRVLRPAVVRPELVGGRRGLARDQRRPVVGRGVGDGRGPVLPEQQGIAG